jgi:hypothetical protein
MQAFGINQTLSAAASLLKLLHKMRIGPCQ